MPQLKSEVPEICFSTVLKARRSSSRFRQGQVPDGAGEVPRLLVSGLRLFLQLW